MPTLEFHLSPVASSEIDVIRNPCSESGFYHIVATEPRGRPCPWQVREPFTKRALGAFSNTKDAAITVVRWYKDHFGPDWPSVFRCRRNRGFLIRKCVDDEGGYDLLVWEIGRPKPRMLYPKGHRDRFETAQEAKAFFADWSHREFPPILGQNFSWLAIRQTDGGTFNILMPKKPVSPRGKAKKVGGDGLASRVLRPLFV